MTPRQRFQAALEMKDVDRVPLFYQHLGAASHLQKATGIITKEGFEDPEKFAKLSIEAYRQFGFDNVMAGWGDILIESQAHGVRWKFTDPRFYPRVESYVPMDRVGSLRPVDPMQDQNWSVMLKGARIMMESIGHEVAVVGCVDSPMVIAMETISMENLMMTTFQDPTLAHYLLRTVTESSIAYLEHIRKIGLEEVFIENGSAGGEMISLQTFEDFDRKYLAEDLECCSQLGLRSIVHNCSASPYYESEAELRPTALHLHLMTVNVPEMFSKLKGRTCVMAGIDHTTLLFKKSPDEVETEVDRVMGLWGHDNGFIIGSGCELPYKTPMENLVRLKRSVEKHGVW
jgi:uroporphyrinogen decarboxylase